MSHTDHPDQEILAVAFTRLLERARARPNTNNDVIWLIRELGQEIEKLYEHIPIDTKDPRMAKVLKKLMDEMDTGKNIRQALQAVRNDLR